MSKHRSFAESVGVVVVVVVVFVAMFAALLAFSAWMMMLVVGIIHAGWWHAVPTMSYHFALVLEFFLTLLFLPNSFYKIYTNKKK